jgi:hypothetical protein
VWDGTGWSSDSCTLLAQDGDSLECDCRQLQDQGTGDGDNEKPVVPMGRQSYAAQFKSIKRNVVQTILYIDDITAQDVLQALPAFLFLAVLCGLFLVRIIS